MINTILFDLDGTLIRCSQETFIKKYFAEIGKVFANIGMDGDAAVSAVWAGTKAMLTNDGTESNAKKFWQVFARCLHLSEADIVDIEAVCDKFYANDFNKLKELMEPTDIPQRLIKEMQRKGYELVLATNPVFPECAIESRLNWIGLKPNDFIHITHYKNSSFCKPNLGYYREIFDIIKKTPKQCMMIGNNPVEDMVTGKLGCELYLVTDCLENEADIDISTFRHGSLEELESYLISL